MFRQFGVFNLAIPKTLSGVDDKLLNPAKAWQDTKAFEFERNKLGKMFTEAFQKYSVSSVPLLSWSYAYVYDSLTALLLFARLDQSCLNKGFKKRCILGSASAQSGGCCCKNVHIYQ